MKRMMACVITVVVLLTACGMVALAERPAKNERENPITTSIAASVQDEYSQTGDSQTAAVAATLFTLTSTAFILCKRIKK